MALKHRKKITNRNKTNKVMVKNVQIGNQNKVVIQSMTTSKTENWIETLEQINLLHKNGCEMVRVAILDEDDLEGLKHIMQNVPVPIIADIHYRHDFAIKAMDYGVSKIRINPGNIGEIAKVQEVINKCKELNIPIRIGINGGSLPKHIIDKYGYGSEAMIASAKENIKILEDLNYKNYILSLKHTDPKVVIDAYVLAAKKFKCPLHIGVTESGALIKGTVKSVYAISELLKLGIGDTIRISLTSDPINEVIVAKEILKIYNLNNHESPNLISCPTCGRLQYNMLPIVEEIDKFLNIINKKITVAIMGCIVNGLGEALKADITVVGSNHKGLIYFKGKLIKIVPEEDIIKEIKTLIMKFR